MASTPYGRVVGKDRYETAARLAQTDFSTPTWVVLASGDAHAGRILGRPPGSGRWSA